jgi:prepilin-type N-terminal cleavage/methylation domain-containing protein
MLSALPEGNVHMKSKAESIKKRVQSEKGFTLIELILAMAIMSILLTMYYSLFFAGGKQYEYVHDSYKKQNEARIAMSFITTKIRQNDVLVAGTEIHAVSVWPSGSGTYLKIESIDADGDPAYEYIYGYSAEGSNLQLRYKIRDDEDFDFDDDGSVIADNLYNIKFTSEPVDGNTCVNILIEYDSTAKGKFEETIVLRAN